jgi:hypothetical protein
MTVLARMFSDNRASDLLQDAYKRRSRRRTTDESERRIQALARTLNDSHVQCWRVGSSTPHQRHSYAAIRNLERRNIQKASRNIPLGLYPPRRFPKDVMEAGFHSHYTPEARGSRLVSSTVMTDRPHTPTLILSTKIWDIQISNSIALLRCLEFEG